MPAVTYTLARVALLAATYGIGYLAGLRDLTLLIVAFLGSGALSLFVLSKQRDQLGSSAVGLWKRINDKIDANTRKEDLD